MKIIDDLIPLHIQNELEGNILNPNFPWGHMFSSDLGNEASDNYVFLKRKEFQDAEIIDPGQFYHNILIDQQPGQFFSWFTPILEAIKFEGDTLHAACPPISNRPRIVVNINIR